MTSQEMNTKRSLHSLLYNIEITYYPSSMGKLIPIPLGEEGGASLCVWSILYLVEQEATLVLGEISPCNYK